MKRSNSRQRVWTTVLAAGSGNMLETFDFAVYAYFASTIAKLYFPNVDPLLSLLQTFTAYGIGFVAKPIGGIVLGRLADARGRKPVLLITITLMAISCIGVGLLPTYDQIGVAAPILLVALRIIQGFATGGEWGTSATYIVEWAPVNRRGFFGSFQSVSTTGGALLASFAASAITMTLHQRSELWAWRIPFIVGGIAIFVVSIVLRSNTHETPEFEKSRASPQDVTHARPWLLGLKAFGFTIFWTMLSYFLSAYMVTYTQREAGLTREQALIASNLALLTQMVLMPFAGALSDRIGRKPLLLASCFGTAVFAYPILFLMSSKPVWTEVVILECCLAALYSMFSGTGPSAICEIFPTALRTTWMISGYTLAVSIFGGFAPLMSTWLISVTKSSASPAFLLIPAAMASGLVICTLKKGRAEAPAGVTSISPSR